MIPDHSSHDEATAASLASPGRDGMDTREWDEGHYPEPTPETVAAINRSTAAIRQHSGHDEWARDARCPACRTGLPVTRTERGEREWAQGRPA